MTSGTRAANTAALAVVLAAGVLLRCWGIEFGLPLTQARPDESRIVNVAARIAAGDLNPHYFVYPTLYMYLLAGAIKAQTLVRRGTELPYDELLLTGRLLTAAFGSTTVLLVYLLGKRVADGAAGIGSAALLAVAFLHVRDSHFATTDVPMTAAVVATVLLAVQPRLSAARLALCGLVGGLAVSLKYSAAPVTLVPVFIEVYSARRGQRAIGAFAARLAILVAAIGVGFLLGTPYAIFDRPAFSSGVGFVSSYMQGGHRYDEQVIAVTNAPWRYLTALLPAAVGWPVLIAGIAGLLLLVRSNAGDGIACLLFPLAYFAMASRGHTVFARYMVPLVPFLCLGTGYVIRRVAARSSGLAPSAIIAAALVLVAGGSLALKTVRLDRLLSTLDNRLVARHWIDAHLAGPVCETGSVYGRVRADGGDGRCFAGTSSAALPPYVVAQRSPLTLYSRISPQDEDVLASHYVMIQTFRTGAAALAEDDYDPSDAFFVPLRHLEAVRRPGPEFDVYERRHP